MPLQVKTMLGDGPRICGECVNDFHAAIHESDETTEHTFEQTRRE
jgi:hypothetical protein